MSVLWGDARKRGGTHALSEIEVDEVSLVDRPATGKRFVLFKRRNLAACPSEEDTNICSKLEPASDRPRQADVTVEELQKRAGETLREVARLQDVAAGLEARLFALETARPARQSVEPAPAARRLWSGVL